MKRESNASENHLHNFDDDGLNNETEEEESED